MTPNLSGYTASGLTWWLNFLKFVGGVYLAFYLPGSSLLPRRLFPSGLTHVTVSILLGLALWGWQLFVGHYLSAKNFSLFYLAFFSVWQLKRLVGDKKKIKMKSEKRTTFKSLSLAILIIIFGVVIQLLPTWFNGQAGKEGVVMVGGNVADNLWHASLTHELTKNFPPHEPGFPQVLLANYHYWANLVIAGFVQTFRLPLFPAQFQFFPLLISLSLGLTIFSLGEILGWAQGKINWALFFSYFGGDLIYLLLFLLKRANYFALSSLEDGQKFLANPPRAFSFVIALAGICLLMLGKKQKNALLKTLSLFLLASTIGFKVYTALFFLPGLVLLGVKNLLTRKWKEALILFIFPITAFLVYWPTNAEAGGLVWTPFAIVNNFIAQPGLGLERWELARLVFLNDQKYLHNLVFELVFTTLFLISILGVKSLALLSLAFPKKMAKLLGDSSLFVLLASGTLASLFLGLFFFQESGGANTFNFIVSAFLFLSLLIAPFIAWGIKKLSPAFALFLSFLIIALTVPRVFFETYQLSKKLSPFSPDYVISYKEIELYRKLPKKPGQKVAVDPEYGLIKDSPYPSIFTTIPPFLVGEGILKSHNIDISEGERALTTIFKEGDKGKVWETLEKNKIAYLILFKPHLLKVPLSNPPFRLFFENSLGEIVEIGGEANRPKTKF